MSALPNKPYIFVEATEKLAYSTLVKNRLSIFNSFEEKDIEVKDLDELRRISCLSLLLGIPNPSEKTNELYKLVTAEWSYFQELGTIKDFTPLLSYRSILYVLRLYNYLIYNSAANNLYVVNTSNKKVTETTLTEEESISLLLNNKDRLEASMHFKGTINDLIKPKMLAEVLGISINTSKDNIYNLIKEHWTTLSAIGCIKNSTYTLSFRGVVYLLQKRHYNLTENLEPIMQKKIESQVVTKVPTTTLTVVKNPEVNLEVVKPDMDLITSYIKSERAKLKVIADMDNAKAKESMTKLNMVETALLLAEDAANLLIEAGI